MTKTEAMIGNLKLKECDSILEFLFNDGDVPENKQQNAARLKFKAGISHEIKNPLNCIISYAELLKKNSNLLQEELKRYVENICISSLQLKNLLVDVIENAKFEYEKITVKKQTFETGGEIKNVLRTFEEQIRSKNIMFSTALMQVNIISDVTKFNQILYNLVSNAVKYTNKNGSIDITSWVEDDKFYFPCIILLTLLNTVSWESLSSVIAACLSASSSFISILSVRFAYSSKLRTTIAP